MRLLDQEGARLVRECAAMTAAPLAPEVAAAQRDADIAVLRAVLLSTGGNVRKAAVYFGIHVSTLQRRITALGLRDEVTEAYPRSVRQPKRARERRNPA